MTCLLCQSNVSDHLIVRLYGSDRAFAVVTLKANRDGKKGGKILNTRDQLCVNTITVGDSQQAGNNKG